jgi:hypothetical protein
LSPGLVVDEFDPVVLVVHRTVGAGGFHEGEIVDACGGFSDLGGDFVIFGDQCGHAVADKIDILHRLKAVDALSR